MLKKNTYLLLVTTFFVACSTYQNSTSPNIKLYTWQAGDTVDSVGKKYSISALDLQRWNEIYNPEDLVPGIQIEIPRSSDFRKTYYNNYESTYIPPKSKQNSKQEKISMQWPSRGTISSGFGTRRGKFHMGIDITKDLGRDIVAVANGKVIFAGRKRGYGKTIVIKHTKTLISLYAHNKYLHAAKGDFVKKGEKIATMGSTGKVTGPHLHFEIRHNNRPINPLRYLPIR